MPLVVRLMAESVGIEHVERDLLSDWSAAAGSLMAKPFHRPTARAADAALDRLAGSLPAHPAADTVLERADGALPGCDPLHLASLFAFAGIETTSQAATRLIDLYARGLVDPRAPAQDAVAAALRFDTAVPQVPRVAAEPTELCGQRVEAGDSVVVILAAANRDPRVFAAPQVASATAGASRHLAYGYGRHRCLGAPLADAVLVELLRELRRHPAPRLPRPAEWYHDRGYRGIASLEVDFEA
jgi:cytochrome P450